MVNTDSEYSIAQKKEEEILPLLKKHFGETVEPLNNRYHPFDFSNEKFLIELKCRNVKASTYPTTIVGMNKIEFLKRKGNECKTGIFVFKFLDGTYFWKFNETEMTVSDGGRTDRGVSEIKKYAYIPVGKLVKME